MKVGMGDINAPMTNGARNKSARKIHGFFFAIGRVINQVATRLRKPDCVRVNVTMELKIRNATIQLPQEPESTVLGAARLAAEYAGWPVEQWAPKSAGQINPRLSAKDASERWTQWQQFVSWSHGFPLKVN